MDIDNILESMSAIISDRYTLRGRLIFHPPLGCHKLLPHIQRLISTGSIGEKYIIVIRYLSKYMFNAIYSRENQK